MEKTFNEHYNAEYSSIHSAEFEAYLNELLQKVPSTTKILLYNKQKEKNIDAQWVDWAHKMLEAGYTSDRLLKFSKLSPDTENQITLTGLANVILNELNLDSIPIEDILKLHGIHFAKQAINNEKEILDTLESLRDLYYDSECLIFYEFPFLCEAYEQLKNDGEQFIWRDRKFKFKNKEEYIKRYLRNWIESSNTKIIISIIKKNLLRLLLSVCKPYIILFLVIIAIILIAYYSYQFTNSIFLSIAIPIAVVYAIVLAYTKFLK